MSVRFRTAVQLAASASIPPSIRAGNGSNYQPAPHFPLLSSPIIARTCSRRSLTPAGPLSSSPTPSPSALMIPPLPPPPLLARVGGGHADQLASRPGVAAATPPAAALPRLGGGGRLAQIAAAQPIACNCGQVFPNLDILERHMAKVHPENTNLVSSVAMLLVVKKIFLFSRSTTISRPHSRGRKAITVSRWICAVQQHRLPSSFVWECRHIIEH